MENEYLIILNKYEASLNQYGPRVRQWIAPVKNRFVVRIWAQIVFPFKLRKFDLVHYTKGISVFGLPIPTILTIHDLTTLILPEIYPKSDVWYWKTIQKWTAKSANLIIAVSKNTAQDLITYYRIPAERIRVVYHGRETRFIPMGSDEVEKIRSKYHINGPYIITVGRLDKKKNLTTLVEAFNILQKRYGFCGKLVLVGEVYKKCEDKNLIPTINYLKLENDILLTGRVPDEDLPALYSGALVFAFTSLHEGFGLVALEAMACGIPVVVQKNSSLSEVVGDTGLLVEPATPSAYAEALNKILQDENLYKTLRIKGLKKSEEYDWDRTACYTLQIYQEVAQKVNR